MTDDDGGRALAERLRAERDERRRLAELIHDGPVQLVSAIAQMLDAAHHARCRRRRQRRPDRRARPSRRAGGKRRPARDRGGIEPDALRELGLAAAIGELASATRRAAASPSSSTSAADGLGDGAQSGLYQIVRDAIDQAVRRGRRPT